MESCGRNETVDSNLVGGLEHGFYFSHHIGNFIIPTDEVTPSFFRGVGQLNHQAVYVYICIYIYINMIKHH